MDLGISGRRAAVAAGSAGLGLAVARSLAAEGVAVAICGRDPDRLAGAAEAHGLTGIQADVSTPHGAVGFVRAARDALGGLDIVVGNAGGPPGGGFDDFADAQAYADAFALNALVIHAITRLVAMGVEPPVWRSGNAPGGDEANARFIGRFRGRVRAL